MPRRYPDPPLTPEQAFDAIWPCLMFEIRRRAEATMRDKSIEDGEAAVVEALLAKIAGSGVTSETAAIHKALDILEVKCH